MDNEHRTDSKVGSKPGKEAQAARHPGWIWSGVELLQSNDRLNIKYIMNNIVLCFSLTLTYYFPMGQAICQEPAVF